MQSPLLGSHAASPARRRYKAARGAGERIKGEATLLAEIAVEKRRAIEQHMQKRQAKKEVDALLAVELRAQTTAQAQSTRWFVINCLISSKKNDLPKFFMHWRLGVQSSKKEQEIARREKSWRKSCSCDDGFGGATCTCYLTLREAHADPLALCVAAGRTLFNGSLRAHQRLSDTEVADTSPQLQHGGSAAGLRSAANAAGTFFESAAMTFGATLLADGSLRRSWSFATLSAELGGGLPNGTQDLAPDLPCCRRGDGWACKCCDCRPSAKLPSFINAATAQAMTHIKTGRRCLVDPKSMRMTMMDATRPHTMFSSQAVGLSSLI